MSCHWRAAHALINGRVKLEHIGDEFTSSTSTMRSERVSASMIYARDASPIHHRRSPRRAARTAALRLRAHARTQHALAHRITVIACRCRAQIVRKSLTWFLRKLKLLSKSQQVTAVLSIIQPVYCTSSMCCLLPLLTGSFVSVPCSAGGRGTCQSPLRTWYIIYNTYNVQILYIYAYS